MIRTGATRFEHDGMAALSRDFNHSTDQGVGLGVNFAHISAHPRDCLKEQMFRAVCAEGVPSEQGPLCYS